MEVEKTFNSVGWEFLYKVIKKFGFNKTIKVPTAWIKVNGSLSTTMPWGAAKAAQPTHGSSVYLLSHLLKLSGEIQIYSI